MSICKTPFIHKLTACALLVYLTLSPSAYGESDSSKIRVTATVLRRTLPEEYKKLQNAINRKIQKYLTIREGRPYRRSLRVTVNLDYPYGSDGILVEELIIGRK
jgi:hypothetical protein